jgi:hypothetical protein
VWSHRPRSRSRPSSCEIGRGSCVARVGGVAVGEGGERGARKGDQLGCFDRLNTVTWMPRGHHHFSRDHSHFNGPKFDPAACFRNKGKSERGFAGVRSGSWHFWILIVFPLVQRNCHTSEAGCSRTKPPGITRDLVWLMAQYPRCGYHS